MIESITTESAPLALKTVREADGVLATKAVQDLEDGKPAPLSALGESLAKSGHILVFNNAGQLTSEGIANCTITTTDELFAALAADGATADLMTPVEQAAVAKAAREAPKPAPVKDAPKVVLQ